MVDCAMSCIAHAGKMDFCVVHEAWYESLLMMGVGMTRHYWVELAKEDESLLCLVKYEPVKDCMRGEIDPV